MRIFEKIAPWFLIASPIISIIFGILWSFRWIFPNFYAPIETYDSAVILVFICGIISLICLIKFIFIDEDDIDGEIYVLEENDDKRFLTIELKSEESLKSEKTDILRLEIVNLKNDIYGEVDF